MKTESLNCLICAVMYEDVLSLWRHVSGVVRFILYTYYWNEPSFTSFAATLLFISTSFIVSPLKCFLLFSSLLFPFYCSLHTVYIFPFISLPSFYCSYFCTLSLALTRRKMCCTHKHLIYWPILRSLTYPDLSLRRKTVCHTGSDTFL